MERGKKKQQLATVGLKDGEMWEMKMPVTFLQKRMHSNFQLAHHKRCTVAEKQLKISFWFLLLCL